MRLTFVLDACIFTIIKFKSFKMFNQIIHTKKEIVEPELKKLKKLCNNKKLSLSKINSSSTYFNCWGFTAFAFNWLPSLEWFEEYEMKYCIENFTRKVKKPKFGDIVVMIDYQGDLEHTAILVDVENLKMIHKPGAHKLEVNDMDNIRELYNNVTLIEFRRPLINKKFNYTKFSDSEFNPSVVTLDIC